MTLVINYLEIENFKSYYGKNTLGPFHQSFNAVIGPNGSGKSNVIDSLLFVFGFRAQKIRTKKISVLIHNSDQHPNVNSCSVTIYFRKVVEKPGTANNTTSNGGSQFVIVPDSEFTVKRTAYKDNSSVYYIDDRKVKFEEVGALLRDCGVDLDHNRFLILQGEVESISLLKAKAANENEEGLLEYLEDIIGTIRYKPILEEIAVEIDKTNEIRTEKANRVENLKKDKNNLEGPKDEALNYLKLENQLIEKKNLYYQVRLRDIEKQLSERREECDEIRKQLQDVITKLDEYLKENQEAVSQCAEKKKEYEKKSKLSEKLKKKFEDFEKEDVRLNEELKHAKEQIKKLEKNVTSETQKIETLREIPERNEQTIVEKQQELEQLKTQLEPANKLLNEKMDEVNNKTKKYQEKKESLQEELGKLQASSNEARSNMDIAQSELDVYLSNQTYEENKLEETRGKLKDITKTLENRIKDIKRLETENPQSENGDFKKKNDELTKVLESEKNLTEKISKERQRHAEAQANFSSSRNRKGVLSFLQQLKAEGKLNGLHGRLGDLGAIDEKYDVAVSTACGALDCIVVDNIDTAQRCVELLKTNNVGSATFIALDKQEKWRENVNKKINTPENVPRLIDLIKVNDPSFLTAFYYSLRNTLVANDLEQGSRIAYGQTRHRVVTLQGQIIETSGTMSGGGNPQRGRMGNKLSTDTETTHTVESLKRMVDKVKDYENELRSLINRKLELEPEVYELKTKIEEAKQNLNKWRMEAESLKEQIKNLKVIEADCMKRLSELTPDPAKQAKLVKTLDEFKEKFEKADRLAAKLRNENDDLHNKILEISKGVLDEPKAKLNEIEIKINDCNTSLTSLSVEIKTSRRNLANSEKKLASIREDLETNQTLITTNEKRLAEMDEEGKEIVEKHNEVKEECKELEAEIAKMTKVIKETDVKKQKLESEKIDHNHNLEKANADLHSLEDQNKHYSHLLKSLRLHDIQSLSSLEAINANSMEESDSSPGIELKKIDEDDLEGVGIDHLKKEIQKLEDNLKSQTPNLQAIQNYRELQIKFMERVNELDEITNERDNLCNKFEDTRKKRLDEFMSGFTRIRLKLKEIYRTVTLEGDAELELVDSLDPFTEGIVLSVRPPKKSWKNVSNLSGGEKTLSSLSLVFALHEFKATPIYVMDEIDAALDFKNVSIIAHYIKERTKNAQFIIISLRNNMFELCDRLFGIYKVKNCTSATYIAPELLELEEKKKKANTKQNVNQTSSNQTMSISNIAEPKENLNPDVTITNEKTSDVTINADESDRNLVN